MHSTKLGHKYQIGSVSVSNLKLKLQKRAFYRSNSQDSAIPQTVVSIKNSRAVEDPQILDPTRDRHHVFVEYFTPSPVYRMQSTKFVSNVLYINGSIYLSAILKWSLRGYSPCRGFRFSTNTTQLLSVQNRLNDKAL